jgi:lipopolysaccharide biosynthesis glycosyltransferase
MPLPFSSRQALVMAFDDAFAIGAETSLFSLLRHNPWFDARVIALCDGVGAHHREALLRVYPIEMVDVAPEIKSIARRVAHSLGCSPGESTRLYSLQLFGLQDLDRAVFLDADTLCTGDVSALFSEPADLAAAPDHVQLMRSLETRRVEPTKHSRQEPYGRPLAFSFNSGVMTLSGRFLTPEIYRDLLQLPGLSDGHGSHRLLDQYVLNHYFDGRVTALDPRYNFLVGSEALLRHRHALTLSDVRVLHFAGCPKPWQKTWEHARRWVPARLLRYYDCWYETRQLLTGGLSDDEALGQQRLVLEELSRMARQNPT